MTATYDKLLRQAQQARRENRLADAERDLVEAIEICRKDGGRTELARARTRLGQIARDRRRNDAALLHYEEAVALYRAEGDALKLAHTVRRQHTEAATHI